MRCVPAHHRTFLSRKKQGSSDTCYRLDEARERDAEGGKRVLEATRCTTALMELSTTGRCTEAEGGGGCQGREGREGRAPGFRKEG